ncbi:Hypothetical predicted protein [Mytilus galloprovincialis]|uniref:Uncharacterized protein n=1 Tax=Mytilus galloprovincialis TaxID=29158 RepID=A0A8B6CAM5_MYTGA|nr:Hypothetical predicted protein [Mytilus galloprovincialis]
MALNALSHEEENYVRMSLLLTGISQRAVRVLFDKKIPPASLSLTVNDNIKKKKLNDLRGRRVINQAQWDLLFPTSGTVDLLIPTSGIKPMSLTRYSGISCFLTSGKSNVINQAVFRLGGNAMKQECDQLMTKPLDMSSQEILIEVQQANKDIESIKQSLDLIQSDHTDIKTDMKTFKSSHDSLKKSCDLLQVEQTESRKDIVVLKSDHQNLKKSHDLLQNEQTVSKMDGERVQKDVNTLKLNHTIIENSQGLLQNDQREVRIDVQNIKSDYEILKTSQDLLQSDQIKAKEDVKKLTSLSEDPVPWNRRGI